MEAIKLQVPDQYSDPQEFGIDEDPSSVESWLSSLPLTNTELSARQVHDLLAELNQSRLQPDIRYRYLTLILPVTSKLIDTLRQHYQNALLPLSEKNTVKFELALSLSNELSLGFRIIIHDLTTRETSLSAKEHQRLLVTCTYLAMYQLNNILVENYLVYYPEPLSIWGLLNKLYIFAENHDITDVPVTVGKDDDTSLTISYVFRNIILTAIANPHHMMHGELEKLGQLIRRVAHKCAMRKAESADEAEGYYVVDLERDIGPRYISSDYSVNLKNPRRIDITPVLNALDKEHKRLQEVSEKSSNKHLDMGQRLYRDMIIRTRDTLNRHHDRQHKRDAILGKIELVLGLSVSHFHVSNEAPFNPELDEVKLHTGGHFSSVDQMSLVPEDFEHWRSDEKKSRVVQGIEKSRISNFNDDSDALDIWRKVYLSNPEASSFNNRDNDMKKLHVTSSWTQKNVSAGGMCIFCQPQHTLPVRVGEVIGFNKVEHDIWHLGVIRWLRVHDNQILEIGIMFLCKNIKAVAARAIKGTGSGCEYFRCLLTRSDFFANNTNIIVPTAIFDVGSELVVNFGDELHYIRLEEPRLTTKSISEYRYTIIDTPDVETKKINDLKRLA